MSKFANLPNFESNVQPGDFIIGALEEELC